MSFVGPSCADFNFLNKDGLNILIRNAGHLNFIFTYSETGETANVADLLSDWMITTDEKKAVVKNECSVRDPEVSNIINCTLEITTEEEYENEDGIEIVEGILIISYEANLETKTINEDFRTYNLYMFE